MLDLAGIDANVSLSRTLLYMLCFILFNFCCVSSSGCILVFHPRCWWVRRHVKHTWRQKKNFFWCKYAGSLSTLIYRSLVTSLRDSCKNVTWAWSTLCVCVLTEGEVLYACHNETATMSCGKKYRPKNTKCHSTGDSWFTSPLTYGVCAITSPSPATLYPKNFFVYILC